MISFRQHTHWQKYGLNAQSSTKGGRVLKENPRGCLTFTICIKKLLPLGCLPYQFNEGFQVTTFYSNYWPQHLTTKTCRRYNFLSFVMMKFFNLDLLQKILYSRLLISTFKRAWLLNNIHQSNTYLGSTDSYHQLKMLVRPDSCDLWWKNACSENGNFFVAFCWGHLSEE